MATTLTTIEIDPRAVLLAGLQIVLAALLLASSPAWAAPAAATASIPASASTSTSTPAPASLSSGRILPIHYADPAAIEQALTQLYGDRLAVARVGDQLILQAGQVSEEETVEAAAMLVAELDIPPRSLQVTLSRSSPRDSSRNPGQTGDSGVVHYQTGGYTDSWHTLVESGAPLLLQRGSVQTQVESAGWGWATLGEQLTDNDHLQLQVFAKGETVRVIYEYRLRHGSRLETAASTITAPLGQWLQILGQQNGESPADAALAQHAQHYSTEASDMGQLWLLVEPAPL